MWHIIKISLVFIATFLKLYSAQVDITQNSKYYNATAGPWRERISHWYDITVIRNKGEHILHPYTFRVINQKKRAGNTSYPTFDFISDIQTPEGVEIDIVGNSRDLQGDLSVAWIEFNGSTLWGTFTSVDGGRAIIDVHTILKIPSSVPDMVNGPIVWTNPTAGSQGTNIGLFNLKTLPDIEVPDFDFGRVIMNNGGTPLELMMSGRVTISGGTPHASVRVFLTQSQVDLVCANTDDTLRVAFAFMTPIYGLDLAGNASAVLDAILRSDQVVESGVYTGTVEVQLEYN